MQCLRSSVPISKLLSVVNRSACPITRCQGLEDSFINSVRRNNVISRRFLQVSSIRWQQQDESDKISRPEMMDRQGRTKFSQGEGKGPVSWVNFAATGVILAILYGSYRYVKHSKDQALEKERKAELGKARIGGMFDLIDHDGNPRKSEDFMGKWILLYFGFTHCPDICPDEMEKMAAAVDDITASMAKNKKDVEVVPLFITVDPERDGVKEVKEYVKEFHPRMIGLTGSVEKIKEACKAYRVYFSAGPRDDEEDYIVDHTIIIYLIDPEGNFVDYYGQTKTAEVISSNVIINMLKFENARKKSFFNFG